MARFRAAYEGRVEAMPDRSDWPQVDLVFKVFAPKQKRAVGRPKTQGIRGCLEKNANKKKVRCKRCKGFGHFSKTCKVAESTEDGEAETSGKKSNNKRLVYMCYLYYVNIYLPRLLTYLTCLGCRKRPPEEGSSQAPIQQQQKKKPPEKKKTPKKKKTPAKKKLKRTESAPPAKVIRSLMDLLHHDTV